MHGTAAGDGVPLRAIARIIDQWAYDIAQKWFAFFKGDTKLAAICLFTQLANSEYILAEPALAARYRSQFVAPADCRPVPVASIAQALNIDAETTRRKITRLKALGLCSTNDRGVIIQLDYLQDSALRHEYENLSVKLATLIGDMRTIILGNGYPPEPLADLARHLDIDTPRIGTCNTLVAIIIAKYLARTLLEGSFIFGSDRDTAAIYFSIYVENERPITHDLQQSKTWGWLNTPVPKAVRRPVSSNFVARQIGLPAETVRRKINGLIGMGLLERTGKGVQVISMPGMVDMHAMREYNHLLNMLKSIKTVLTL
jgi:DeoR/GlpR family transcriptional regulator of sugar metabolism